MSTTSTDTHGEEDDARRRVDDASPSSSTNPLDINGSVFNADMFSQRMIKDSSLSQLMAQETEVKRQIQSLDSDMQVVFFYYFLFFLELI